VNKSQNLHIVIPCYNEASKWPYSEYHEFLEKCPDTLTFLFVNDGSTDNTREKIDELAATFPNNVTTLHMKKNGGKSEAVRQGILLSMAQSNYSYLGYWDADLSTPITEINHLSNKIEKFHEPTLLMGSRVKILGTTNIQRRAYRHYVGRIIATLISKILNIGVYDTQCGAKLIKASDAGKLMAEKFISRWLFDVELLFRIMKLYPEDRAEKLIIEVPLNNWIEKGDSKISMAYFLKIPYELFRIYRRYRL